MVHVHVTPAGFRPRDIEIPAGETVAWYWDEDVNYQSVTAGDGSFDSGRLSTGASFEHTFTTPGTFLYHSVSAYPRQAGTVVVLPP